MPQGNLPAMVRPCAFKDDREWENFYRVIHKRRQAAGPSAAFREFMTNKPNPPEHATYMARAAELYPDLPPGAQQAALHALESEGKGRARRYVTNARSREAANQRHIMGITLETHRRRQTEGLRPVRYAGSISAAQRKVYQTCAARWTAWTGIWPDRPAKGFAAAVSYWREAFAAARPKISNLAVPAAA